MWDYSQFHPPQGPSFLRHRACAPRTRSLQNDSTQGKLKRSKVWNYSQFCRSQGSFFGGHHACVLPTRSLQNDSTEGKSKSERCGTTANFAFLRDPLFGGTALASYLLVLSRGVRKKSQPRRPRRVRGESAESRGESQNSAIRNNQTQKFRNFQIYHNAPNMP